MIIPQVIANMLAYVKRKSKLFLTFFPELCLISFYSRRKNVIQEALSSYFPNLFLFIRFVYVKMFFPWSLRTLQQVKNMPWNITRTNKCSLLCLYPLLYSMKFHSLPFTLHLQMQQHEMLPGLFVLVSSHSFICNSTRSNQRIAH